MAQAQKAASKTPPSPGAEDGLFPGLPVGIRDGAPMMCYVLWIYRCGMLSEGRNMSSTFSRPRFASPAWREGMVASTSMVWDSMDPFVPVFRSFSWIQGS